PVRGSQRPAARREIRRAVHLRVLQPGTVVPAVDGQHQRQPVLVDRAAVDIARARLAHRQRAKHVAGCHRVLAARNDARHRDGQTKAHGARSLVNGPAAGAGAGSSGLRVERQRQPGGDGGQPAPPRVGRARPQPGRRNQRPGQHAVADPGARAVHTRGRAGPARSGRRGRRGGCACWPAPCDLARSHRRHAIAEDCKVPWAAPGPGVADHCAGINADRRQVARGDRRRRGRRRAPVCLDGGADAAKHRPGCTEHRALPACRRRGRSTQCQPVEGPRRQQLQQNERSGHGGAGAGAEGPPDAAAQRPRVVRQQGQRRRQWQDPAAHAPAHVHDIREAPAVKPAPQLPQRRRQRARVSQAAGSRGQRRRRRPWRQPRGTSARSGCGGVARQRHHCCTPHACAQAQQPQKRLGPDDGCPVAPAGQPLPRRLVGGKHAVARVHCPAPRSQASHRLAATRALCQCPAPPAAV
ncbi:hypothetical protein IWQ56_005381, partial [Coemansia nantahalensis]